MNIVVLSSSSFDENYSSYHLMEDIILALLNRNHRVVLIQYSSSDHPILPTAIAEWSTFSCFSIKKNRNKRASFIKRYLTEVSYYYSAGKVIKSFKDETSPDIVFIQSNNVLWAAIRCIRQHTNAPLVYNEQDLFPENAIRSGLLSKGMISRVLQTLQKSSYEKCSRIITISADMRKSIMQYLKDPVCPIDVVPNWGRQLPEDYECKNPLTDQLSHEDKKKVRVVYAGTIGKMQGIDILVKAAKILEKNSNILFYIIGDGSSKNRIVDLCCSLKCANVKILDSVSADYAPFLYRFASINYIPLVHGAVKTCLPSKTADCFASHRPLIVQIDEDSLFAKQLRNFKGVAVIEPSNEEKLAETILTFSSKYGVESEPLLDTWPQGSGDDYCRVLEETYKESFNHVKK